VFDICGWCKINLSWIFNQFNCYQLSFYLLSSTTAKNSSGMLLNLLSILDLMCSDQVSALYHVWWGEIVYLLTKIFRPIHTHCKYNKLIFMYPLRHMYSIWRRTYSALHLLPRWQLYHNIGILILEPDKLPIRKRL
jgi:hypothetical protein